MTNKQYRVVKLTINLPMDFPADWTDDEIDFYLNESSSCADNRIRDLEKFSDAHGCICCITQGKVLEGKMANEDEAFTVAVTLTDMEIPELKKHD